MSVGVLPAIDQKKKQSDDSVNKRYLERDSLLATIAGTQCRAERQQLTKLSL